MNRFSFLTEEERDCIEEALAEFDPMSADCGNYLDESELKSMRKTTFRLLQEICRE